jgi:hypothetical protein
MKLYIQIKNGKPFEHPILESNFVQAFPHVNTENLPPEFARFERVERPHLGVYQVLESEEPTYELIGGVYKDVWRVREMTQEEKEAKIAAVKALQPFPSWVFKEETCSWFPPVPFPTDTNGKFYEWIEEERVWKLITQ